jgi:hypothetical protein
MKEETKAGLIIVLIIVLICLIGYLLYQKSEEIDDPAITIARLDSFTFSGAKAIQRGVYIYYINGRGYRLESYFNTTLIPGDRFKLIYSQKDPSKSKLISFDPVFTDDEDVFKTIGTIKDISNLEGHYVAFEFTVEGIKYFRVQEINPQLSLEDIDLSTQFLVYYWRDNPQRSVIELNQPIK